MRTAIYIDGFNLYYWLKKTPYRWVNLETLALNAISRPGQSNEVVAVKYFTARVADTRDDPDKSTRQDIYFQALRAAIPSLQIVAGEFRRQKKPMPRALKGGKVGSKIWVWDTEEKGSDVNLAVELVNDCWQKIFDMAVVISNDSDLDRAVRIVKRKGYTVGILVRGDADVVSLKKVSSFTKRLTEDSLKNALMPRNVSKVHIPPKWQSMEDRAKLRN